jgi:CheY-like chemotaxis protein
MYLFIFIIELHAASKMHEFPGNIGMEYKMNRKLETEQSEPLNIYIDNDIERQIFNKQGQKPRILHIDDEDLVLSLFEIYFRDSFNITSINDEYEALKKLETEHYDLIVADYQMNEMDGQELLSQIRRKSPETQVIFLSSIENEELADKVLQSGAFDFITKNYSDPLFRLKIKQTVSNAIEFSKIRMRLQMQIALFMNIVSAIDRPFSLLDSNTNEVLMSNIVENESVN